MGSPLAVLITVLALLTTLNSCVNQGKPDFDLPVAWSHSANPAVEHDVSTSLLLHADGSAHVTNAPVGNWHQTSDGICWDATDTRYTGSASWRAWSARGVEVEFDESLVIFWAYPGKYGSYGWDQLKMVNCDGTSWGMGLACGRAGYLTLDPCIESRNARP